MKRILTAVILTAVALTNLTIVSAREDESYLMRANAVEAIVKTMYFSGGDTDFTFEYNYCIQSDDGGSVRFMPDGKLRQDGYPILCELYNSVTGCGFSDISEENGSLSVFISLAKAMNIINGYPDGTFRPDKPVTYNEAVAMLVRAFGFGSFAGNINYFGYPDGSLKAAADQGITTDMDFSGNDAIARQDFYAMLAAALENNQTKNLLVVFVPPSTADECVSAYAKACMDRDGAMQFALYDDELKEAERDDFISWGWVSGMSSPYIADFEIVNTGDLEYEVKFYYATSTGPGGDSTVKLMLCEAGGGYRITDLNYVIKTRTSDKS